MSATLLAMIGFGFALRGSYLQKKAKTIEDRNYSMYVCGCSLLLTLIAFYIR
jgi:hypothetical protein